MFKKILKTIFRDDVFERKQERAIKIVKHFQESKVQKVCHVLGSNIQILLEDGSWYMLEPHAMRKPNETKWESI